MELTPIAREEKENASDYALRVLSRAIARLQLRPGEFLSENEVGGKLNLSRTPVREAFIQLSRGDMVIVLPQRGTYVARIDISRVKESVFLRETMERAVMDLACASFPQDILGAMRDNYRQQETCLANDDIDGFYTLDAQFHGSLFEGCGKPHVWQMIMQMGQDYNRVRMLNLMNGRHNVDRLLHQHRDILRAILAHDPEDGARAIAGHIGTVMPNLQSLLVQYPHYFRREN